MTNDEGLWDYPEAAEYLKIAIGTLRNWVHAGKVPHLKVSNRTRFRKSDLDKWLDEQVVQAEV